MHYKNIAISGGIGVGTTTLMKNLVKVLEQKGWRGTSTGNMVREYLKDNIMPLSTQITDEMNREIEDRVEKRFLEEEKWIIEGWLAAYKAQISKETLKVLLICSDFHVRVDRVSNREDLTIEEATKNIKEREETNLNNFKRLYGDIDFFDPKYYDLVIDTLSVDQHTACNMILKEVGEIV